MLWQPHHHGMAAASNLRPDRFGGAAAAFCTRAAAAEAASRAEKRGSSSVRASRFASILHALALDALFGAFAYHRDSLEGRSRRSCEATAAYLHLCWDHA